MQDDSESSARTADPPTGDFEKAERERAQDETPRRGTSGSTANVKPGAVPMPDTAGDDALEKTGQSQGQSRGKPQTRPQE